MPATVFPVVLTDVDFYEVISRLLLRRFSHCLSRTFLATVLATIRAANVLSLSPDELDAQSSRPQYIVHLILILVD